MFSIDVEENSKRNEVMGTHNGVTFMARLQMQATSAVP
jgi:hypothetical protein